MPAILLSIGDELALGQTVDTNSAWLAARLARLGISTLVHETVADDRPLIAAAIRWAASKADLLIITGGLGPTDDDLTRQALADAMGVGLELDPASLEQLERWFRGRSYPMAERNRVQAMCPVGARMIPNAEGTAPGIAAHLNDAEVYVTPGVPREMRAMYEAAIEPELRRRLVECGGGRVILTAKVNTFGMGESDVAERLGPLMERGRNPTVGTTVSDGLCSVRVRSEGREVDAAQAALEETLSEVEATLHPLAFGRDGVTLPEAVVGLLVERGQTVSTAESCTGGLIGAMLTDVPGSSAAYLGGWVTYTDELKMQQLGVESATLKRHGAVSAAVVRQMAEGARRRSDADVAVAVSGVAGPGGGTTAKPVGTVWLGLASGGGTSAYLARLIGGRAAVRDRAAKCALQLIRLTLLGQDVAALRWLRPEASQADR